MRAAALRSLRWDAPTLTAALIAVAAVAIRLTSGPHPVDDAFITFRYAANLSTGRGLVYNSGDNVLGTSTPLYTVLLALVALISGNRSFPDLAVWINAIADGFSVYLVFLLCRRFRLPTWAAISACLMFALSPLLIRYSIGGMETSILTAVSLLAVYLFLAGQRRAPFHLAGLAVWLRPDAMALAAALLIAEAWQIRRVPWRPLLVVAAWIGVEMVLLATAYGDPLPHSVTAKANHVYLVEPETNFFQHVYLFSGLTLTGVQGFGARGLVVSPAPALNLIGMTGFLLLMGLWAAGIVRLVRENPRALVIPMYLGLFTFAYTMLGLGGGLMAEWYLVPLIPYWVIPLTACFAAMGESRSSAPLRIVGRSLPMVILVLEVSALNWGRNPALPVALPLNVWSEREDLYQQAAEFLDGKVTEQDLVAASEIGALGYACDCRILDTVGLVSPAVQPYYPLPEDQIVGNYAIPTDLILTLGPEYLVTLEVFIRNTLLQEEAFRSQYRELWRAPTSAFGSDSLRIFGRVDIAAPPE